jgi:8-oxo-dGTP diphosphatase
MKYEQEQQTLDMVVGFMFSKDKKRVVLIRKEKPSWQAGLLNGVGGKLEPTETYHEAMAREFAEETGVGTDPVDWEYMGRMHGPGWVVSVFRTFGNEADQAIPMTKEQVSVFGVDTLLSEYLLDCVSNLSWLIPFCLDEGTRGMGGPQHFNVSYLR